MFPISEIKDRLSVIRYARERLGMPVEKPGDRCPSFREGSTNETSFMVGERTWRDWGGPGENGLGGDVIDLAMHAVHHGDFFKALRDTAGMAGVALPDEASHHGNAIYRQLGEAVEYWHQCLLKRPDLLAYLYGRGLKDETITALKLGYCPAKDENGKEGHPTFGMDARLIIPYWKSGRVCYVCGRATRPDQPEKYKKLVRSSKDKSGQSSEIPFSDHPVWGVDSLRHKGTVIIAEGAFDALSAWQEGLPVVSPITGRFSLDQEKDIFDLLRGRAVTVCMDYDPKSKAGQEFTLTLAKKLFASGIHAKLVMLEGDAAKVDLSELYAQGEDIKALLSGGVYYLDHMIDTLAEGDDEGLRTLLRIAAKALPAPELARHLAHAKRTKKWDIDWLRALAEDLKRPPSDEQIVEELTQAHRLAFHEKLGWYEYDPCGVWKAIGETEIEKYISKLLGHLTTGRRISSALRVARAECVRNADFNQNHDLLNLKNGMLRVATRELLPHDAAYYSTIQLDYNYDPKADCRNWIRFLMDVTDDEEDRLDFIQEMMGYSLTPSVAYQLAFFLLGDGANGKSVLLDLLTALIGEANTANVEINALVEPFSRICLYGKLVNIAAETESSVKGTETIFKNIVHGDAITGCYKFKDSISFRPFCKMVFAANQISEANDITHGFIRSIRFLRFPIRFCDNPQGPNQKQKDRAIKDKLLPELSGILNWALVGLDRLTKQDGFTATRDDHEIHQEFMELSNPLVMFLEDYRERNYWADRSRLYEEYTAWCKSTNTHPYSARKFWDRLRKMIEVRERKVTGIRQAMLVDAAAAETVRR
jgi:P4 family phage/plasmid primase-like protien